MAGSSITTDLFLAFIVLTSTILAVILAYLIIHIVQRNKKPPCSHQELEPRILELETGRESRLSHRLSRQQIQQEHYEDLMQHYSSVPPSPSIELLPEIKTSSSDDRASEWLEQGVDNKGAEVVHGDLGEKKPDTQQVAVLKPKKQLRWDWRDGKVSGDDGLPKRIEKVDKDGMVCVDYRSEKLDAATV